MSIRNDSGPCEAVDHRAPRRRRAPIGSASTRSLIAAIGRSLLSPSPLMSLPTVSLIARAGNGADDGRDAQRLPRVPRAARRQHVPPIGGEAAVVGAGLVVEPDPPRVGVAEADVVALLQRVGDAAAPAIRHPLVVRDLHRLVVAVEHRAGLHLEDARERRVARLGRNQLARRIEHVDARPDAVDRLVDVDRRRVGRARRWRRSRPTRPMLPRIWWVRPRLHDHGVRELASRRCPPTGSRLNVDAGDDLVAQLIELRLSRRAQHARRRDCLPNR